MKKVLIRAKMSPLKAHSPMDVLNHNLIGNNIGNMLFPYSIGRSVMTDDTEIYTLGIKDNYSEYEIRNINETYDCLILPFANAFRSAFINNLHAAAQLVKRLNIPCIVVGIGAQANLEKQPKNPELEKASKEFVSAVLEKSAKIGLRGEFTADFLQKLGFQAERDFTVIGCPSMYLYGSKLPEMVVKSLSEHSAVSINSKIQLPQKFHNFMARSRKALPNYCYVPQVIQEIDMMYRGQELPDNFSKKLPKHFPVRWDDAIYTRGKACSFIDVPSWLEYLRKKDFSFGSRIHGNIAAVLAGTPCFIVVSDQRVKELVEYHKLPHMFMSELTKKTSIFDLHEQADFAGIARGHQARFAHYLDFLHENGLQTVFDENTSPESTPFDQKVDEVFSDVTQLVPLASLDEKMRRKRLGRMNRSSVYYQKVKKFVQHMRGHGVDIE